MKKLLLSLIILCSAINPMLGMEGDEAQQGAPCGASGQVACEDAPAVPQATLGESALCVIANHLDVGNTCLVRSIACEWLEQHPNGTYRDFVNRYNRTLPVNLMRAVWLEVMRSRQIGLSKQIAGYASEVARIINQVTPFFGPNCQLETSGIIFDVDSDANQFEFNDFHKDCRGQGIRYLTGTCDSIESVKRAFFYASATPPSLRPVSMSYYGRIWLAAKSILGRQALLEPLPLFCTIKMPLIGQQLSPDLTQRLSGIVQEGCRRGYCVLIQLVSNGASHNISHIIVVHNGVIALVPSIVVPAGASDAERQQITQAAIEHAIDHQPVFRTILEAIQYLEGLGL